MLGLARHKSLIVVLACAMLLGGAMMSLRQASLEKSAVRNFLGKNALVQLQVITDPNQTKPKVFGSTLAPTSYSFLATALRISTENSEFRLRVPIRVIAQTHSVIGLLPGQIFEATASVRISKEARVAALVIVRGDIRVLSPPSRWARALGAVRLHLREISHAVDSGDGGALIPGMVLGDTVLQDQAFRDAMRRSGLTHLTAVSGANFAIISLFVLWCMQWFFRSLRVRLVVTTVALLCFIALVRPSPSVLRAAAMASVVIFARGARKRSDSLPALGFAIAAVVVGDPWQARDPGFALSVLATAGLLLLAPRIARWLARYVHVKIAGALSPPIAAVVMCAPILVALSGYLGPMTVIANVLVAPMVAPITVLGFLAALFSPVAPGVSWVLLMLVRYPADWIAGVAHWSAKFPVVSFTTGFAGFAIALGMMIAALFLLLFFKTRIRFILSFFLVTALIFSWVTRWPGDDWQVANCDVGQGDSMVINLGSHRGIVIDTGPDGLLEDKCLGQLGIREIPLLILTHFHADHVEGVAGLINHRSVGQVWVSANKEPLFESERVRNLLGANVLTTVVAGTTATIASDRGVISLQVLWPDDAEHAFDVMPGDGSAINNASIALLVKAPDFTLFAAGDLEPPAQAQIVDWLAHVDIYKVSHHGSLYQELALMQRLSPTLAIISVGTGNSYGHPSPQTLAVLDRLRSRVYRTDKSGAIAIVARAHRFEVRTSGGGAWWKKVRLG